MKIKNLLYLLPLLLIFLSVIVCFNIFLKRLQYDDARQTAQFSIHENDIDALDEISGLDRATVLSTLKNQVGITSVIVQEPTIFDLEQQSKLTVLAGNQIINMVRVGQLYRTGLSRLRSKTTIKPNQHR